MMPYTDGIYTLRINVRTSSSNLLITLIKSKPTCNYDNYAQELREELSITNQLAKEQIKEEKIKAKQQHDKKAKEVKFNVGVKVLVYETLRLKKLESL